jgi:hypothetical protein
LQLPAVYFNPPGQVRDCIRFDDPFFLYFRTVIFAPIINLINHCVTDLAYSFSGKGDGTTLAMHLIKNQISGHIRVFRMFMVKIEDFQGSFKVKNILCLFHESLSVLIDENEIPCLCLPWDAFTDRRTELLAWRLGEETSPL